MIHRIGKHLNKKYFPENFKFLPENIVLGVNNVCNLHCKMCDVGTKNFETNFAQNLTGTKPINMPLELVERIANQTAAFCPKSKVNFAFTEPLAYPQIAEAVKLFSNKSLYTTITTNALTLPQKAEKLSLAGLNELFISLDGPEQIHNEIRGHQKSFQKAIEGIALIKQIKPEIKITLIFAITEWNQHTLVEFAHHFKTIPIDEIAFMHTQFADAEMTNIHNQAWLHKYPATISNLDEVDLKNMNVSLLNEQINIIKSSSWPYKIYFSPDIQGEEILEKYYFNPKHFFGKSCHAIFSNIMIKTDGSCIPAHGRCFNLPIGNIYENNIKEIWNSNIYNNFRKDVMSEGGYLPACSRCCSAF